MLPKYTLTKRDGVLYIYDCDKKLPIRRTESQVEEEAWEEVKKANILHSIKLKGEMANDFNDSWEDDQYYNEYWGDEGHL